MRKSLSVPVGETPIGYLDKVESGAAMGWCLPISEQSGAPTVKIIVDGVFAGSGPANTYRPDVQEAGHSSAHLGFVIPIPQHIFDGNNHIIEVEREDDHKRLNGSPKSFTFTNTGNESTLAPISYPAESSTATINPPALFPYGFDWKSASDSLKLLSAAARNTNGRIAIVYPIIDWAFRWQRPQQIMSRLAEQGFTVLWLAHVGSNDYAEIDVSAETVNGIGVDSLNERVFRVWLKAEPGMSYYTDPIIGERLSSFSNCLTSLLAVINPTDVFHVVQFPGWYPLSNEIQKRVGGHLVYDCMDHHAGFKTNTSQVLESESKLIRSADLIIASSLLLEKELKQRNENTILVKNATDFDHFKDPKPNGELDSFAGKKIIGYIGAIADWFDIDLVETCAKARPQWEFVLIGSTAYCDTERIEELPNVHFLGEKPFDELPGYMAYFDVCTIPFQINDLTKATNPVKLYEYLSAGKPVVATHLPELEPYRGHVSLADDADSYLIALEEALETATEPALVSKRIALAKENDWDHRVERILREPIFAPRPVTPGAIRASIVLVTYNGLDAATRPCVESILENTPIDDYELIIVDNLSEEDDTREWLQALDRKHSHVRAKLNPVNKGFAGGNNDGIRLASGDFIILLNNDTLVPEGWLDKLLRPFNASQNSNQIADQAIGLVGPVTNSAGNEQGLVFAGMKEDNYTDALQHYMAGVEGLQYRTNRLGFFCVAIRRTVFDEVGLLDEQFGIGMFEDDDFCVRCLEKGFQCVVAEDCFIYHKGSVSFSKLEDAKYREVFDKNLRYFNEKHGRSWSYSDMILPYLHLFRRDLETAGGGGAAGVMAVNRCRMRMDSLEFLSMRIRSAAPSAPSALREDSAKLIYQQEYTFAQKLRIFNGLKEKLGNRPVVVFPLTVDWAYMKQRPQQMAAAFADHGYAAIYTTTNFQRDNVELWQPAPDKDGVFLCHRDCFDMLQYVLVRDRTTYYCMWPNNLELSAYIPHARMIYDYMDELELLDLPIELLEEAHLRALAKADLITVTADKLYEKLPEQILSKTLIIPNGVSEEFIAAAVDSTSVTQEIKSLSDKPIVGYFGALAEWFDFDLMSAVAEALPECNIVLIGPVFGCEEQLGKLQSKRANIHVFPEQPHEKLVGFLRGFTVAIIPFLKNRITDAVSPVKLFEYMAAGKPVVTTDLAECRKYPEVKTAMNANDFVRKIKQSLEDAEDPDYRERLRAVAAQNTWTKRVEAVLQRLDQIEAKQDPTGN